MEKQYRYPGTQPFFEKDRQLFFGRDVDIEKFSRLIVFEKLVVLIGRSGFGKTSLLNAGVIPRLIEQERHVVLPIEFKEQVPGPLEEQIKRPLKERIGRPLDFLLRHLEKRTNDKTFLSEKFNIAKELPKDPTAKLWYYTKIIQILYEGDDAITLVFDHFEELFINYPNDVDTFSQSMATLLNFKSPKSVRSLLKQKVKSDKNLFTETEIEQLLTPLNLKVVLSIRNDYLGELDRLKKFIPEVFNNTYELLPLNGPQALEALVKPAELEGDFSSPSFMYTQEVQKNILKELIDSKNKHIEGFQLQLIGQYAEESIVSRKKAKPETTEFHFTDKDLGKLDAIWEGHYKKIIAGLPIGKSRKNLFKDPLKPKNPQVVIRKALITRRDVKAFIENVLIVEGNRVPVDIVTIEKKHKIPKIILASLEVNLLLRPVLNSVGTTSYELSHDNLVAPILKSREKRRKKEMIWLILAIGLLGLILGFGFGYGLRDDESPVVVKEPIIEEIKFIPINMNFTVHTYPSYPCENASVKITTENGMEEYTYEIIQPDGTKLESQGQDTIFKLSQIGDYTIKVTDSTSTTSMTKQFNVPKCKEDEVVVRDTLKEVIKDTTDRIKPVSLPGTLTFSNANPSIPAPSIGNANPSIPAPSIGNAEIVEYNKWVDRLNILREKLITDSSIESDVRAKARSWRFNKNEVHLIGIRVPSKLEAIREANRDEVLLILLIDGQVFKFISSMEKIDVDSMLERQRKYSVGLTFDRPEKEPLLRLEGETYVSSDKSGIPYDCKNEEYECKYEKFNQFIESNMVDLYNKNNIRVDEVYYTSLDRAYFLKAETSSEINEIYEKEFKINTK